ncbi:MAG TPA: 7TM domain-containing protein [Patescibacteria group bacterium]|nr:7TM domain-containing protein [Patescibacteria group bacterium]
MRQAIVVAFMVIIAFFSAGNVCAQNRRVTPTLTPEPTLTEEQIATFSAALTDTPTPTTAERPDLTQKTEETIEPLRKLLNDQKLGNIFPTNFIKYAIRRSVDAGVPPNTLVLILMLPFVAMLISAIRQLIGLRGFGIFLPASLSVVFVATGPFVGVGLFLLIVFTSTFTRMALRRLKIKLQYLPRMALILWTVSVGVLGVLFATPYLKYPGLTNVSIFAVLILTLLTEDFIRIQLGKSIKTAMKLTNETIILAVASFIFLTYKPIQEYALLHPEAFLLMVLVADILLGRYSGLRILELWRFRKLIKS